MKHFTFLKKFFNKHCFHIIFIKDKEYKDFFYDIRRANINMINARNHIYDLVDDNCGEKELDIVKLRDSILDLERIDKIFNGNSH